MKKTLNTLLMTTLAVAAVSSASQAEDRWPNWYVGLHGSMVFIDNVDLGGNPAVDKFEQDSGYGYGVSLGYRPYFSDSAWSDMRLELQWQHQRADIDKVSTPGGSINSSGDVRVNAVMFNVYYDAPTSFAQLRPYVGTGLGWAKMHLQNANATLASSGDEDTVFAWNLMAGLGYVPESLPYTEWSIGYRYFSPLDSEFSFAGGGTFEMEYDSHNIEAGVRFLF